MRKLHYCLVDVFTQRPFGGNQLAVFTDGQGLTTETMQALAREFNFSETTFVLPAQELQHNYQVRIFTPTAEMPMAGHPTVGTAFVLAHKQMIQAFEQTTTIYLEEGVGPIRVTLTRQDGQLQSIRMTQPLPTFGPRFSDRSAIAQMLSLDITDIDETLPLEVVSCGVPFLYVPVKSLAAMHAIRFRQDVWERTLSDFACQNVFAFSLEVENPSSTVHSRMFAPALGVNEDPATGAASGPLGCYLVRYGKTSSASSVNIVSEQGLEVGRPSFIQITIERSGEQIIGVHVGGQCYFMGEGHIELADN